MNWDFIVLSVDQNLSSNIQIMVFNNSSTISECHIYFQIKRYFPTYIHTNMLYIYLNHNCINNLKLTFRKISFYIIQAWEIPQCNVDQYSFFQPSRGRRS